MTKKTTFIKASNEAKFNFITKKIDFLFTDCLLELKETNLMKPFLELAFNWVEDFTNTNIIEIDYIYSRILTYKQDKKLKKEQIKEHKQLENEKVYCIVEIEWNKYNAIDNNDIQRIIDIYITNKIK